MEAAGVEIEATEPVDALRRPVKDIDSRLPLRCKILFDVDAVADGWRGTRDVDIEGEPRIDECLTGPTVFTPVASPFSIIPNSLVEKPVGEGFVEEEAAPVTLTLMRRLARVEGEAAADVRLEMRGILVGVSFG